MTPKLSDELREALQKQPGKPLKVEDDQAHVYYVVLPLDTYQKVQALLSDDNEFDPDEFMPLVHDALADVIDVPGMELYDNYDDHRPQP